MKCLACRHDNRALAKFCEECGARLSRTCPHCHAETRPGARFCDTCGHLLETFAVPARPQTGPVTPAGLAEAMRRHRPAEGERRSVTVLFADAVGSTPLAERLGEEQMYSFVRECLSRMTEAVHYYEGYVASFTGDGIMALFGAPIAHEDSARRAVTAAMRMQRSLDQYVSGLTQQHGVLGRFRVGLNTGPVVVGTVTDDLRMDFTAIGDTVNLAARMQQIAEPGCVFISERTYRVVGDYFDCQPLGELTVKGKLQPLLAWRVVGERPVRTRFEVAAERGLARFVGRDRELAVLEECLEMARLGAGQVVLVSGEAGIGKSRLLFELRRRLAGQDVTWIEGRCISYGTNIPYLPVVDLLKNAFGIQEEDNDAEITRRVDDAVAGWEESARGAAPYLKYLLSVDIGDHAVATMDPPERRVGVFQALRAFLIQESLRRRHVVVVEDLHWADEVSREALASLVNVVHSVPVLLVFTFRPGYGDSLEKQAAFTGLTLGRLDDEQSLTLAEHLLQGASLPPELKRLIAGKAEGNPFYIEEVTKGLVETGVLARTNGSYRLQRPLEEVHIPNNIQEVILSRIDRLEADAKRTVQLASVIGREFTARLLDRISDLQATLLHVLGQLTSLELIHEKDLFPELAYIFKHALTHDVAYSMLLTERRRALHRLVGVAIEELYADRLPEHYEILAQHYYQGQDWDKALDYLTKAGDKATDAYASQQALHAYARALEVCEKLGEKTLPIAASIGAKRGFVNFGIGDILAGIDDFHRMVQVGRRLGDRAVEGTGLAYRGLLELYGHDFERSEETLRSALAVVDEGFEQVRPVANLALVQLFAFSNRWADAKPLLRWAQTAPVMPDPFTDAFWNWFRGIVSYWEGRFDQALGILKSLSESAERMVAPRLANWWIRGMALAGQGEYEPALRILRETLDAGERVGAWQVRSRVVNTIGWVFAELEDHEQALEWNRAGVALAGSIAGLPNPEIEFNARLNLADNLVALGQPDAAEQEFKTVEAVVRNPTPAQRWLLWRYSLHFFASYGELWLDRGHPSKALAYADECLQLAEHSTSRKYVVRSRRLRGQAFLAQGRFDHAEQELSTALQLAIDLANPPQLWKTHAAVGDLRRAQGNIEDVRRAYGRALSVIEAMAAGLTDDKLRETLLHSQRVAQVRRAANVQQ
ncbi:MAG TPA: adenylate/guanylate cyclase domain-containing protein [Pseudonocardiaceae bacterium]